MEDVWFPIELELVLAFSGNPLSKRVMEFLEVKRTR